MNEILTTQKKIYRLDKFVVPIKAREEFLEKVQSTHELLRTQPGFGQDFLLEQPTDGENFHLATLVEWQNAESIENARAAVMTMHQRIGLNTKDLLARLGIKADIGNYKNINDNHCSTVTTA